MKAGLLILGVGAMSAVVGYFSVGKQPGAPVNGQESPSKSERRVVPAASEARLSPAGNTAGIAADPAFIQLLRGASIDELRAKVLEDNQQAPAGGGVRSMILMETLMFRDGAASFEFFREERTSRRRLASAALRSWGRVDPGAAIEAGLALLDHARLGQEFGYILPAAFGELARRDPDRALKLLEKVPVAFRGREMMLNGVLGGMIGADPERALGHALEMKKAGKLKNWYFLSSWAQGDPEAAVSWLRKQSAGVQKEVASSVLGYLGVEQPQRALEIFDEIVGLTSGDRRTGRVALGMLAGWMGKDFELAVTWLQAKVEAGSQPALLRGAIEQWARSEPAEVAARLATGDAVLSEHYSWSELIEIFVQRGMEAELMALRDGASEDTLAELDQALAGAGLLEPTTEALLESLRSGEGSAGVTWALRRPEEFEAEFRELAPEEREAVLTRLGPELINYDPERILRMASQLEEPEKYILKSGLSAVAALAMSDPASAAEYSLAMPEGDARDHAVANVVGNWFPDDPAGAEAWLMENGRTLQDRARRTLIHVIGQNDEAARKRIEQAFKE